MPGTNKARSQLIGTILLLAFVLADLWVFVLGVPPMWEGFRTGDPAGWGILLLGLRGLESLFLISLPLSATLLLLRSRWAVVVGVAQLPVRVLCGYSMALILALWKAVGEPALPQLPWLPVTVVLELLRIGMTAVVVRGGARGEPLRPSLPPPRRGLSAGAAVVVLTLFLGWLHLRPGWPEGSSTQPTAESLLEDLDRRLAFDVERPESRTAIAVTWQGDENPEGAAVDTLGRVHLGTAGIPDSLDWTPACGPWNLGPLIRFELDLFAGPWTARFGGAAWTEGATERVDDGWRVRFVHADSLGESADLNTPVVRGFQVWIDKTGVPRQGFCELDMKLLPARAFLGFEYEEHDGRLRIQRIHHQIDMANVRIRPQLDLRYRTENGVERLDGIDFSVPMGDLSPTLGQLVGGIHFTRLRLAEQHANR